MCDKVTESKEDTRLATIERLWGDHPKVTTAGKLFDFDEATAIATKQEQTDE